MDTDKRSNGASMGKTDLDGEVLALVKASANGIATLTELTERHAMAPEHSVNEALGRLVDAGKIERFASPPDTYKVVEVFEEAPVDRAAAITRRAKMLSVLEGAVEANGVIFDILVDAVKDALERATPQEVRHDLARLMEVKLAEERPPSKPGGSPRYMGTLLLENKSSTVGETWHSIAEFTLRGEEPEKAPEPVDGIAAASDPNAWIRVAEASADKERADKAAVEEAKEAATPRKGKRGKRDEPNPQLGLGSAPGRFTMDLPCPVGVEEREIAIREHLAACDEIDEIEDEKKAANERFAARRKEAEAREQDLRKKAREVMTGERLAPIECEQRLDGSTMRIIRCDTYEVVEERSASADELSAANPPPATVPAPEGVEIRAPEGSALTPQEAQATGADVPAEAAKAAPKKRGRKSKADAATLN